MKAAFQFYQKILHKYPVTVQAVQTSLLMATGDFCAQVLVEEKRFHNFNFVRTLQFSSLGIFLVGPVCAKWYALLAKHLGTEGKAVALKKVICDQLIFAPCMMVVFLTTLNTIKLKPFEETKHHLKKNYFDIMIANYKLWPAIQLANFYIIPTYYQLLLVQTVSLFWNTYLAWKTAQQVD